MSNELDVTLANMQSKGCLANLITLPFVIIGQLLQWAILIIGLPFVLIGSIFSKKD